MNILRWKRKSKKKIKLKTLILFIFSLIMTTFAWFAYSRVLNTSLNMHMVSWDIQYYIGAQRKTNPIGVEIDTLYPAMDEQTVVIDIKNQGEALVDIQYHVESLTIAGVEYEIVQEGKTNTQPNFIYVTPSVLETDATTGIQVVKGAITNDITKFPFTIEIEHSPQIQPATGGVSGQGYLKVTVNWIGDNHELDSEWGHRVAKYLENNPSATVLSAEIKIDSFQADPKGGTVTETLPSTAETKPYLPTGFTRLAGTTLDTGLVIKDASGNQYVWVEVPKTLEVYPNAKLNITEFTETEYATIESDLRSYSSSAYTRGNDDYSSTIVYRAVGLSIDAYNELKQKMLKSIYQNGGFYIGRYETGIADTFRNSASNPTQTAVVKQHAYPYNWITCSQAQTLATNMESGSHTSSLLFGVQWELALKFIENKTSLDENSINEDSSSWGSYYSNSFDIISSKAKYNIPNLAIGNLTEWISAPYSKKENTNIALTTGATSIFSKQNIYDLAGNGWEWTLGYSGSTSTPCVLRGGIQPNSSEGYAARYMPEAIDGSAYGMLFAYTFRVAIY